MTQEEFSEALSTYVPKGSAPMLTEWIYKEKIHLTITQNRKSKLGDFRTDAQDKRLRISVNGDLNPYSFLITLVHEIAHAIVHKKYGRSVKPHGWEWKECYQGLMIELFEIDLFPKELALPLLRYLRNPKASSNADKGLFLALRKFDEQQEEVTYLQDLKEGEEFILNNILFRKGKKRRTRYTCINVSNNRLYTVNALAEVIRA